MPEWQEWLCLGDENGTFSSLQELYIIDCPKLKGDLPKTLPLLRKFGIENCEMLDSALSRAPDMDELELVNCDKMQLQALPTELQNLTIKNCSVQDSTLELMLQHCSRLEGLSIGSCAALKSLPEGRLPVSLKKLEIDNCGSEFYGNGSSMKSFESLEILRFEKMPEWQEWLCLGDENGTFSSLQELYIIDCPKLKGDLPKTLPLLRKFRIENCEMLGSSLSRAPDMRELELVNCDKMQLQELPTELQNLTIKNCSVQDSTLELMRQHCSRLEGLSIGSCAALKSLPEGRLPVSLKKLEIENCGEFDFSRILLYTSLEELNVWNALDSLESFPLGSFPNLNTLNFVHCTNIKSFSALEEPHQHLASLHSINMFDCPNFVSFPKGGLSAPNLTMLYLFNCKNLKSLPEQMHSLLPSLHYLIVANCSEIESFPEGGLPFNLEYLEIDNL
ncbi:hypothetical protein SCA6_000036 [Theobroma cacao]